MVYIFNKYIAPKKTIKIAFTTIFGIGKKNSQKIANKLCVNPKHRFWKMSPKKIKLLKKYISKNFLVNVALKNRQIENIKKMIQIKTYRGLRHSKGLPVRGQQTRRNAKTQKKLNALFKAKLRKGSKKKKKTKK